ncbi:hypothetical protein Hdeb2414_s0203g00831181 [Helianthus debilis subsp. tardiflorus]
MELHSAKNRIQLFKKLICGTSGLHYFHKKAEFTMNPDSYILCNEILPDESSNGRSNEPSLPISHKAISSQESSNRSEYGLYDVEAQPFHYLRVKKPESLAKSDKPYLIKDFAIYRIKEIILKALISNLCEVGPQYPMLGACNMHGLKTARAADTTSEKPFIRKESRLKKELSP